MIDTNIHLKSYHDKKVMLTELMKDSMRQRRNANQERLAAGLEEAKDPQPLRHVKQGSYAMHTQVQSEVESSDIDDGAVFGSDDLVGPRGAVYTPREAKEMVRDAISSQGEFKTPPEVRTNCVRVYYADGFQVDIPVYREVEKDGELLYELASTDWKESDPEAVTNWFNSQVIAKSPDETDGRQMRRVVCLMKAWAKSRKSWNMPSGFILSVLVDEAYPIRDASLLGRDDDALIRVIDYLHSRLIASAVVRHPVLSENITKTEQDACMVELRDRLQVARESLADLRKASCSELEALKIWRGFFDTDHFDARIQELEEERTAKVAAPAIVGLSRDGGPPEQEVIKRGGEGRYA